MSRDFTPEEWGMIHEENPELINVFDSMTWVLSDGTKMPLISKEELDFYRQFHTLNFVGRDLLSMCYGKPSLRAILKYMEKILNGSEDDCELAEMIRLWYKGKLVPGYYMDENNKAMYKLIREY